MKRKDMLPGVLYAISADGYNTRPGYVLDAGKPPNKVRVRVFWTWKDQDEDYLNPTPPLLDEFAKYDDKKADTNGVIGLWSEYCSKVKAERQAALDKRNAEEAAVEARRLEGVDRVEAVADKLIAAGLPSMLGTMRYYSKANNMGQYGYTTRDVLDLIESLTADTPVSQS
jgi:hypothetical protein